MIRPIYSFKIISRILLVIIFYLLVASQILSVAYGSSFDQQRGELSYKEIIEEIDESSIMRHVEKFASFGSRVTGYPGYEKAAEYIYDEFLKIGLVNVTYDYFDVAVPIDYGANITVEISSGITKTIKAYPLWPNLFQTSPTPPSGLKGTLIYVGKGLKQLEGKNVTGKIVLMDFNSGYEWKRAFAMGAKVVIFIEPESGVTREEAELKVSNIPIYAPRLYVSRSDGEFLKNLAQSGDVRVTVVSSMKYEKIRAKNVIGYIPGRVIKDQIIAISAYYDSFSFIPSLSPGAQEALGISTVLELARFFKKHPPLRTVEFIAFAGHHQHLAGATEWTEKQFNNTVTIGENVFFKVYTIFSLDYSTEVKTLGIFPHDSFYPIGGSMYYQPNPPRNTWFHAVIFDQILPKMKNELGYDPGLVLPVADDPARYSFEPIPRVCDASALEEAGGIGFGIRTTSCLRRYEYVPSDTPDRVNLENLRPQLQFTYICMYEAANIKEYVMHETTPERVHLVHWGFGTIEGQAVTYNYSSGWYDPLPHALIYLRVDPPFAQPERALFTDIYYWIGIADEEGRFTIHGVRPTSGFHMWYTIEVYKINWTTGEITHAPDLGQYGSGTFSNSFYFERGQLGTKDHPRFFVAFPCATVALYSIVDPTTFDTSQLHIEVNSFFSHGPFLSWGTTRFSTQRAFASTVALPVQFGIAEALAFLPPERYAEILIRAAYYQYPIAIFMNASEKYPRGAGYKLRLGEYFTIFWTPLEAAKSLYSLVKDRFVTLSSYNIRSQTVEYYYSQVLDSFSKIDDAIKKEKYNELYWKSYSAWASMINEYFSLMDLTFETVYSSIFFYVLLLPFTFLAERLFFHQFGKRRLLAMIVLFAFFTLILYLFHPGFHIASSIFMATLGFTILALASPLLFIIAGKLSGVIVALRKRLLGEHFAEISRTSALLLAFSVGIENMRRRKLRSGLTLFTITTITFSLILFTSGSRIAITKGITWENVITPYAGFLIRELPWKALTDEMVTYVIEEYGQKGYVAPRFWAYGPSQELPVQNLNNGLNTKVAAILGVTATESEITNMDKIVIRGRFFVPHEVGGACIISDYLADKIKANVGDCLDVYGLKLTVIGIFKSEILYQIIDLDQEVITPRDISIPLPPGMVATQVGQEVPHVSGEHVILVPYEVARRSFLKTTNAGTYSIAVKFDDPSTAISMAERFSKISRTSLFASAGDGKVSLYVPRKGWALSGLEFLATPLIIGIFIILNTMLGSISERVRDISTFSSLGLSPMHVAGMFLAESVVYGVLAGTVGYVAGMIGIGILTSLAIMPPEIYPNYSSYMVILAVMLALIATIVSAVYPLYKAARLVTPTVERKWKPRTKPRGTEWVIPLPFDIPEEEASGVLAFMKEYMEAHSVERAGMFMARNVEPSIDENGNMLISAEVRLEPFEVGIVQLVKLIALPSGEDGKSTLELYIKRKSGVQHTWRTSNITFAMEIRRQLLIWSSLRSADRERYIKEGRKLWKKS